MTYDTSNPSWPHGLEYTARLRTPFSVLGIREREGRIVAIDYLPLATEELAPTTPLAAETVCQLLGYVDNPHTRFDLPLAVKRWLLRHEGARR
jgi:hypothetical protein